MMNAGFYKSAFFYILGYQLNIPINNVEELSLRCYHTL